MAYKIDEKKKLISKDFLHKIWQKNATRVHYFASLGKNRKEGGGRQEDFGKEILGDQANGVVIKVNQRPIKQTHKWPPFSDFE